MRTSTIVKLLALPVVALVVAACGRGDSRPDALTADLQRDLQLASANLDLAARPQAQVTSALETTPLGASVEALRAKPKPGPKALRSNTPTVAAAPEPQLAESSEELEVVETPSARPAESETPSPAVGVALPRPVPVPVSLPSTNGGPAVIATDDRDTRGSGGGIIGVVIRGGGVADDDCEIHDRARGRGRAGQPVYRPNPNGGIGVGRTFPPIGIGRGTYPVSRGGR